MTQFPAIRADDVAVVLGGRPVVRQVDLRVARGEFVTLLGTNGSGKSTLVRALMGLVPLASGRVELLGNSLPRFDAWSKVGYVPQRSSASSGVPATVREVVTSGRISRHRRVGWPTRGDLRAADRALEQVRLLERAKDSVVHLSGGQQQRVMIARALATAPELLVMDEPTAGVDHTSQDVLSEVFGELVRTGTAVVLVAHELGPMTRLVDRAVVLSDGRVVFEGPAEQAGQRFPLAHEHAHTSRPEDGTGLTGEGMWR